MNKKKTYKNPETINACNFNTQNHKLCEDGLEIRKMVSVCGIIFSHLGIRFVPKKKKFGK